MITTIILFYVGYKGTDIAMTVYKNRAVSKQVRV